MTRPHSPSRGIMYTAPPSAEEPENRANASEVEGTENGSETEEPEYIEASANWTGTVSADD